MAQYDRYNTDILKVLKRIASSLDKIEKKMPDKPMTPNKLREEIKIGQPMKEDWLWHLII